VGVNVLERSANGDFSRFEIVAYLIEGGANGFRFGKRDHSDLRQHFGLGLAAKDIVTVKAAVKADRFGVKLGPGVHAPIKPATPCFLAHENYRSRLIVSESPTVRRFLGNS